MFNLPQLLLDSKFGPVPSLNQMIVKLRFPSGRRVKKTSGKNRHIALAIAALMTPGTLMLFVMAMWRIGADVGVATEFPVTEGIWSHWQIWIAATLLSHSVSVVLNRYGTSGETGVGKSILSGLSVLAARQPSAPESKPREQQGD